MSERSENMVIVPVRVSEHINERIEKLVKSKKYPSKSDVVRTAIIEFFVNHKEDFKEIL